MQTEFGYHLILVTPWSAELREVPRPDRRSSRRARRSKQAEPQRRSSSARRSRALDERRRDASIPRFGTWDFDEPRASTRSTAPDAPDAARTSASRRSTTADRDPSRDSPAVMTTRRAGRRGRARSGRRRPRAARRARRVRTRAACDSLRTARHPAVDDLAARGHHVRAARPALRQRRRPRRRVQRDRVRTSSTPRTRTARSSTRCPAARTSPRRRCCCCARRASTSRSSPGVSFADLAWARLGIDPLGGVRVVDARAFAIDAAGLARTDADRAGRHAGSCSPT